LFCIAIKTMKNTTEACLAAGGVTPPKSVKRLCPHGLAPANIVTVSSEKDNVSANVTSLAIFTTNTRNEIGEPYTDPGR
jgi:hypothetical protein